MGMNDLRHWRKNARSDGVSVYSFPGQGGTLWGVIRRDGSALTICPCCDNVFRTERAAKLVADILDPPREELRTDLPKVEP